MHTFVCLSLHLKRIGFKHLKWVKRKSHLFFGVKLKIFAKVLNCWKDKQIITIDNVTEDKWRILFSSDSIEKTFEMSLFDFDNQLLEIPDVDYDVDTTIRSNLVQELVSEMGRIR